MTETGQEEWAKAFAAYGMDAATGRLFRGLAHNINGVAQAFSMQTELLQMLFTQAGGLLAQGENAATPEEGREICRKLKAMLERRASLVVHLEREVKVIQEIMGRCSGLVAAAGNGPSQPPFSLRAAVETELEFLNGDGFFKHRVRKTLTVPNAIPSLPGFLVEIHQIIQLLLENASQSLQATWPEGQGAASLEIAATLAENQVRLAITDNGAGVAPELQGRIFAPFFSTRPGRLGMGLWLAREMAARFGGVISYQSQEGLTTFTLAIPGAGGGDVALSA